MIGMSKALAAEVASRDITVNCVAPGFIASPMTEALNDKQRESILATVPMGRLGPARYRRRGRLPGERQGGLHHRANAARQWRNGNDLRHCRDEARFEGRRGLSPCLERYAIEPCASRSAVQRRG